MEFQHQKRKKIVSQKAESNPCSEHPEEEADNSFMPGLNDELALLCLAKTSMAEYGKLYSINKRYLSLSQSGDLYKMRRKMGISEQWIFMLDNSDWYVNWHWHWHLKWRAFDPKSGMSRSLPVLPESGVWTSFHYLCVGTQLQVYGEDDAGLSVWRYELVSNEWLKGHSMITPRPSFASATCANVAFVAGGVGGKREVLKCAEKYDAEKGVWEPLPDMIRARKLGSGCLMDNRFYVIGGTGEDGDLSCGEFYDFETKKWELISDMLPHNNPSPIRQARTAFAVGNNELYALDESTNRLKQYSKESNKWKDFGQLPVSADWVALRSSGDELVLMGSIPESHPLDDWLSIYTCCPQPNEREANWQLAGRVEVEGSIGSCTIMSA